MMANIDGTCYQRTLRAETKVLYKHDEQFPEGGFKVLREGRDACFVAAGYMVHECLRVADEMAKSGRKATVIDAYALPIANPEQILAIAARSGGTIVTVEDNYTGGLDAEMAIAIARNGDDVKLKNIFVDRIPKSGREPDDVLNYLDLGAKAILQAVS
jgi:transketolase